MRAFFKKIMRKVDKILLKTYENYRRTNVLKVFKTWNKTVENYR